jgi:hypothetical protein
VEKGKSQSQPLFHFSPFNLLPRLFLRDAGDL